MNGMLSLSVTYSNNVPRIIHHWKFSSLGFRGIIQGNLPRFNRSPLDSRPGYLRNRKRIDSGAFPSSYIPRRGKDKQ